ncbi:MAG: 30S ribosome-binding factor RbfA [Deltaproteobacteria bacterium]|jgi:ribosome-binding factor A|nr:30S ribosome-binding factor RbfA [Deltaproteobacteria bacterium]
MKRKRQEQMASLVEGFVANLFVTKVSDPRLKLVNVTRSKVSADLRSVAVFYSILGGGQEEAPPKDVEKALASATGFIRSSMAKELSLRSVPTLRFVFDRNPGHAQRIQEILSSEGIPAPGAGDPPGGGDDE